MFCQIFKYTLNTELKLFFDFIQILKFKYLYLIFIYIENCNIHLNINPLFKNFYHDYYLNLVNQYFKLKID